MREVVIVQPLLVGAFAVRITNHTVIRILQQSAVTGSEGVSMQYTRSYIPSGVYLGSLSSICFSCLRQTLLRCVC